MVNVASVGPGERVPTDEELDDGGGSRTQLFDVTTQDGVRVFNSRGQVIQEDDPLTIMDRDGFTSCHNGERYWSYDPSNEQLGISSCVDLNQVVTVEGVTQTIRELFNESGLQFHRVGSGGINTGCAFNHPEGGSAFDSCMRRVRQQCTGESLNTLILLYGQISNEGQCVMNSPVRLAPTPVPQPPTPTPNYGRVRHDSITFDGGHLNNHLPATIPAGTPGPTAQPTIEGQEPGWYIGPDGMYERKPDGRVCFYSSEVDEHGNTPPGRCR